MVTINLTHSDSAIAPCWSVYAGPVYGSFLDDANAHCSSPSCAPPGRSFHRTLPLAGTGRPVRAGRHGGYYLVHGAGHSTAGGPGFHDPVAAFAQPVHRFVHVAGNRSGG